MKTKLIIVTVLFLSFLMSPLMGTKSGKSNENADITTPTSSSGELGLLWEQEMQNDPKSFCIKDGFIYTLSEVDNYNLIMEKRFADNGTLIWQNPIHSHTGYSIELTEKSIADDETSIYTVWTETINSRISIVSKWDNDGEEKWNVSLTSVTSLSLWGDNQSLYVTGADTLVKFFLNGNIDWSHNDVNGNGGIWGNTENVYIFGTGGILKFSKNGDLIWGKYTSYDMSYPRPKSIWGNEEFLFSTITSYINSNTDSRIEKYVVSKWNFNGDNIWNFTSENDRGSLSIYGERDLLYSFGEYFDNDFYALRRQPSLSVLNITTGTLVWEKNLEGSSFSFISLCIRINNKEIYTTEPDKITKWVYDKTVPILSNPSNRSYEQTDGVKEISWTAEDENPDSYVIYKDSQEMLSGSWTSGQNIICPVSNISLGSFNYTIITEDLCGNNASNSVIVNIVDTIKPEIYKRIYDDSIKWTLTDENPDNYIIYKDGQEILSGSWTSGETILVSIEDLEEGTYNYIIIATDTSGNFISSDYTVEIEGTSDSSRSKDGTPTPIGNLLFILFSMIGLFAAIVVTVIIVKKKGLTINKTLIQTNS